MAHHAPLVWPLEIRACSPDLFTTPKHDRDGNPFERKDLYERTLSQLRDELTKLGATSGHLQLVLGSGNADLRQDGQLRSRANIVHPGVCLTVVTADHGTLVYTCDQFESRWSNDPPGWQINLRAITLGLHDLRRLDRYGIAKRGQQYAGFRELGSGTAMGGATQSREQVARYLATMAGWDPDGPDTITGLLTDPGHVHDAYRAASKRNHPDVGGNTTQQAYINTARDHLLETAVTDTSARAAG